MIRPILNLELQGACTGASGSTLDLSLTTVTGLSASIDVKDSVRVATIVGGNITLSGVQTIDGISVVAADRVLVKNQTTTTENGIYLCAAGAWTRATDFNLWTEIPGSVVSVEAGTVNAGTQWLCNVVAGGTIGSTAISFVVPKNFVDLTTSQTVTGTKTFTAPVLGTPTSGTLTNCTGLPVSGITASTTLALGVGSIEIGHATANTLTASSGVLSIEGKTVLDQTNTLTGITNKTFVAPVLGAATATSINNVKFAGNKTLTLGADITTSIAGYIATGGGGVPGGYIDTSSNGGSIDTGGYGGNIYTRDGGGSISTEGTGSIELGVTGTRTTFRGNAAASDKTIDLPNLQGTVVVTATTSATATHALFAQATSFPAYRAITSGDITPSAPTARAALTGVTNAIAYSVGTKQSATMSAAATISSITGGADDGATLELWVKGHASSNFLLKCTPPSPSDSLIDMATTGKTITANKIWVLGFTYFANIATPGWRLVSLVGGF